MIRLLSISLKSGGLITVLVMLPNIVWMLFPKTASNESAPVSMLLGMAENIGRVAVLVIPFFYALNFHRKLSAPIVILMGVTLCIYYACWIRYFLSGQSVVLFHTPFLGIPLPMAVAPVLFLILSAYLMNSAWMLAAVVWFGIFHLWVTATSL